MGGHSFVTPFFVPTAFANTSLGFAQGFGVYWFEAPRLTVGLDTSGMPIVVEGAPVAHHLLLYGQTLTGQIGILNRVSVDLRVSGRAAVGGDLDTIFRLGALTELEAGGGPKVRLFTLDDVGLQASVALGLAYGRTLQLAPAEIVRNLANVVLATDRILMQTEVATLRPALLLAEGLGPIGVQLAVAPAIALAGSAPVGDWEPAHELRVGLHAALDVSELEPDVPVGLTAEYALGYWVSQLDERGGELDHHVVGGLYYTGRRDFELGGALCLDVLRPPTPPEPTAVGAQMVMRYYF